MRRQGSVLIVVLLSGILPAQESRRSECAQMLDRFAAASGDSAAYGAAALVEFVLRKDEPAYAFAGRAWLDSLDDALPAADAAETLRAVRDDAGAPGPERTLAARMRRALLARHGDAAGLVGEARQGLDGDIRNFQVIGPFGFNAESLAGFAFPPEKGLLTEADLLTAQAGFEGPVKWKPYAVSPAADAADPFEVLSPRTGATYSLAQIFVKEPRNLILVLHSESSVELFVDAKPALTVDHKRELVPSQRWVEVAFPTGWHQLLVKTTDSGDATFRLSVWEKDRGPCRIPTDPKDATVSVAADAVERLSGAADSVLHPVSNPASGTGPGGAFVASDIRDLFKKTGDRATDLVAACLVAWRGLAEDAFVRVEPLMQASDLGLGELWLAARIVSLTEHLPDTDKKARMLDLAKRAAARDATFAPAVVTLARNEATNDRVEEGVAMAQKALDAHPKCVDLWEAQLDILASVGFESDRDRALDAALTACPGAEKLHQRRLDELERKRALGAWIEESIRMLGTNATHLDVAWSLAERLLKARRLDELGELLAHQRALRPHDVNLATTYASLLREQGDVEGELAALLDVAARHDKETDAIERAAQRLLATKPGDPRVLEMLRMALARDPDLHQVRRLLGELSPPPHDYFEEFRVDTNAFLAKAPGADVYPDSRIVLLLDQITLWIRPDGSAQSETHQLHRIQDPRGKEDLGTVHADGDVKIVQTILPDGKTLVPNQLGRGSFEMAGLAPGVVVERRFRRSVDRFVGRPEAFGGFYFQDTRLTEPFHYTRYVVVVPKALGLEPVVERFGSEVKKEERGDDVVYEFKLERMPRIQREAMMPRAEDLVPHVEFRRPDQWDRINRRYLDAYEPAWKVTPTIEEAALKAVGDATDPLEKARKLYDFVMDTVTSNDGYGSPTQVLLEKSGDRFPLYLSLLKAAGVPHTLAMGRVQEKLSPPIDWKMVSDDLFEIPLARIEPPGAPPAYVSTQFRWVPFGKLQYDVTDAPVFVTGRDGGRIERLPAAPFEEAKTAEIAMDLTLDATGLATGTVRMTLPGWRGAMLKEQIERTEKKRLDQMFTGAVLGPIGRLAPKPKGAVRFKNATSRSEPLVIEVDVEMKQLVRKTEGGGTIENPFRALTLAKGFVDRKERKLPFAFHQYYVEDAEAVITLDPAWKVAELPKDFERKGPLGSLKLIRKLEGTKLTLRREIALTPADVPAAGFPDVASFAKDVDQAEAQKITLTRETE